MEVSAKLSDLQIQKVIILNVSALLIEPVLSVKGLTFVLIFVKMEDHVSAIMKARSVVFVLLVLVAQGKKSENDFHQNLLSYPQIFSFECFNIYKKNLKN